MTEMPATARRPMLESVTMARRRVPEGWLLRTVSTVSQVPPSRSPEQIEGSGGSCTAEVQRAFSRRTVSTTECQRIFSANQAITSLLLSGQ